MSNEERGIALIGPNGRCAGGPTVDRIDPKRGYEIGNMQILTNSENSAKMHADKNEEDHDYLGYHSICYDDIPETSDDCIW